MVIINKMAVHLENVDGWLRSRHGVVCKKEWLEACLSWISQEEGGNVPLRTAQETVYQQWLHTDLRETSAGCLPPQLFQPQSGEIDGHYIVQINSLINIGAPIYSQLQTIQGMELDDNTEHAKNHSFSIKPSRMLLITITDGRDLIQGMEYQLIRQLSVETPPGTKLLLKGPIKYRLGAMLLVESHVTVLGGNVEELVTQNNQKSVLSRKLNIEEVTTEEGRPLQSNNNETRHIEPREKGAGLHFDGGHSNQRDDVNSRGNHRDRQVEHYITLNKNDDHCNQGAELYTSFNDSGCDDERLDFNESNGNQFCDLDDNTRLCDSTGLHHNTGPSNSTGLHHNTGPSNSMGPSGIILVPVCRVFQSIAGKPSLNVYTKASVSKIEGELTRNTIDWSVGATIFDNTGELPVNIGNKPIKLLTGFTLAEFKSRIIPTVQMRQGLLRCHRTLLSVNCVMELQWVNGNATVTRLLDVNKF